MAIPALCQAALFCAEVYLNNGYEQIAVVENNELEANAIVLNLIAFSDNGWGIILDESMRGIPLRRSEFQLNQIGLKNTLEQLKNLPVKNALTEDILAYANVVVDVLAKAENDIGRDQNEAGGMPGLFLRLGKVRKTANTYIINFQHLLDGLNKQRAEIHTLKLKKEKQHRLVQQFLVIALIVDIIVVFTLPIIFLKNITDRLSTLLENANRLSTENELSKNVDGNDEISFLNDALCDASRRLAASENKRQLLMDMLAHDIRSPLTSAELLLHETTRQSFESSPELKQNIANLQTIFKRITRLVENLLSIERLESGDFELQIDFFDMNNLIEASLLTVAPQANAKQLKIKINGSNRPAEVAADPERIAQVLDNLLSNAVKYSPAQGTINIGISRSIEFLTVTIKDEGAGLSKSEARSVFNRRFQTQSGRELGGFGLGLTIARQIILKHGGTIELSNAQPFGCKVSFNLPVDD